MSIARPPHEPLKLPMPLGPNCFAVFSKAMTHSDGTCRIN